MILLTHVMGLSLVPHLQQLRFKQLAACGLGGGSHKVGSL
jgi:hypothetical protein